MNAHNLSCKPRGNLIKPGEKLGEKGGKGKGGEEEKRRIGDRENSWKPGFLKSKKRERVEGERESMLLSKGKRARREGSAIEKKKVWKTQKKKKGLKKTKKGRGF